jgi:4-hydroxybenzoate-CoA ligase
MATECNAYDWFVDRHIRSGEGERRAFQDPWRSLTYAALAQSASRFAAALGRAGIRRERRVAMLMLDTVDFPPVFWGCLRAGVIPVPINTLLTPETVAYILADSRAEAVVVSAPLLEALRPALDAANLRLVVVAEPDGSRAATDHAALADILATEAPETAPAACSPDEPAFWLYSSGSTGAPKGVRHVHSSLRYTADTYGAEVLQIGPDDVMFSAAKAFHAYGLGNTMTFPMSVGASAVMLPGRPTPDAVLETMALHHPTLFGGVPTLYASLLANPMLRPKAGSDRLRRCISAGEALPADIGRRWQAMVGLDILDGIGSTEMLHIFISNQANDIVYGTSGKPVSGYEAMVIDEFERPSPFGEIGELIVKGPSAADGYWNQRDKTRRTFRGEWTYTGDKYTRDAQGYYRFAGRTDEMLKVSGVWVSPFEVEEALISHPTVLEAAVIGRIDRDGLLKPKAFVILKETAADPDALIKALQDHVKARVGVWKYPRWIEFVDSLPKTATGKIQRFRLREI